jgi:hypothetical protein
MGAVIPKTKRQQRNQRKIYGQGNCDFFHKEAKQSSFNWILQPVSGNFFRELPLVTGVGLRSMGKRRERDYENLC